MKGEKITLYSILVLDGLLEVSFIITLIQSFKALLLCGITLGIFGLAAAIRSIRKGVTALAVLVFVLSVANLVLAALIMFLAASWGL